MKITRLGTIDIGANSVKLLISDIIDYDNKVVYKVSSFTRVPLQLGNDTFFQGYVCERNINSLIELIRTFISLMKINDVEMWSICGTSALREAFNVDSIVDMVQNKTGETLRVISPAEETSLINLNLTDTALDEGRMYVIADVGGGCTDITLSINGRQLSHSSFKLGTIRLLTKKEERAEWDKIKIWLQTECNGHRDLVLVGSGGNIQPIP